jgi:aspartyl-tRNA(Asn)/glutamyl-tRNA(Gln) amidotransferase subunit C
MTNITKEDIEHVATLARLKLTDAETEKYTKEIGEVLNYVEELNQAPTKVKKEAEDGGELKNIVRVDEVTCQNDRENMLSNAPEEKNGFIKVKKVFE